MATAEARELAERVLVALTHHHVNAGNVGATVKVLMSPHDVRVICAGRGPDLLLWGAPVVEVGSVSDGHPQVQITVVA